MSEVTIRSAIARAWVVKPRIGPAVADEWDDVWSSICAMGGDVVGLGELSAVDLARLDALVADALVPVREAAERGVATALLHALATFAAENPDRLRARGQVPRPA